MKKLAALIILACLLSACAQDVASRYYASENFPPKQASQVEILWKSPQKKYIVIADFQSRGESPDDMRAKAAKVGADAVIVQLLGGFATFDEFPSLEKQHSSYSRITGTAIRYTN